MSNGAQGWRAFAAGCAFAALAGCVGPAATPTTVELTLAVEARERAFAQTMARRDYEAFLDFLADDAVFMSGDRTLRGKGEVGAAWRRFFADAEAPFSWAPDQVEVLASGTLAWSTGPVRDRTGRIVARFSSVWRRESGDAWRIVLDRGTDVCECAESKAR